jgi:hypothetical protein
MVSWYQDRLANSPFKIVLTLIGWVSDIVSWLVSYGITAAQPVRAVDVLNWNLEQKTIRPLLEAAAKQRLVKTIRDWET